MPRLPNAASAAIDPIKIAGYLLSPFHRDGAPKAQFFSSFGFSRSKPDTLATALRWHALSHDVEVKKVTSFGTIFEVVGPIQSPDGRNPRVRVFAWYGL